MLGMFLIDDRQRVVDIKNFVYAQTYKKMGIHDKKQNINKNLYMQQSSKATR